MNFVPSATQYLLSAALSQVLRPVTRAAARESDQWAWGDAGKPAVLVRCDTCCS